jgi:quercetin 2,3-dioxygenase
MKTISIIKRPAAQRGTTELGWLHSRHTFSFGDYFDSDHMGYRSLRVLNDDIVEPGQGFGTHGHQNAEIFSYVIEGQLQHKDSMGNGSVIQPGDLQYMSAASGIRHSEFNPSPDHRVHFLQIWLLPTQPGGTPRYAEMKLGNAAKPDALTPLFVGQHRANAEIYFGRLAPGKTLALPVPESEGVWIHLIAGKLTVANKTLSPGDGVAIEGVDHLDLKATDDAQFLVFVLA